MKVHLFIFYLFCCYIYPPDFQENDAGANTWGKQGIAVRL